MRKAQCLHHKRFAASRALPHRVSTEWLVGVRVMPAWHGKVVPATAPRILVMRPMDHGERCRGHLQFFSLPIIMPEKRCEPPPITTIRIARHFLWRPCAVNIRLRIPARACILFFHLQHPKGDSHVFRQSAYHPWYY